MSSLIQEVLEFDGYGPDARADRARLDAALNLIMQTDVGVSLLGQVLNRAKDAGKSVVVAPGQGEAKENSLAFLAFWDPTMSEQPEVSKLPYERGDFIDANVIFHELVHLLDMQTHHPDMENKNDIRVDGVLVPAHEAAATGLGPYAERYFSENTFRKQVAALTGGRFERRDTY